MKLPVPAVRIQQMAAFALAIAGIIHIFITPEHWDHALAHGLFFLAAGLVELVLALVMLRWARASLNVTGLVLAVGLIVLWAITRLLPAPFGYGPEEVDTAGLVTKTFEAVAALALAWVIFRASLASFDRATAWRTLRTVAVAGLAFGVLSYGVARAGEPLLPSYLAQAEADHDYHTAEDWDEAEPLSAAEIEAQYGIRVTLIGVTAGGGLIDFRYKVLDVDKAAALMADHETMPLLVAEDSEIVLTAPEHMRHDTNYKQDRVYFMLYTNRQNALKPGTPVSLVVGDARLEHLTAQ